MNHIHWVTHFGLVVCVLAAPALVRASHGDGLTPDEVERLRNAQGPSERIKVYLSLGQVRLDRLDDFFDRRVELLSQTGQDPNELLGEYIAIDNELKDWIEDQYDRGSDMRSGLRRLLEVAPKQMEELRHIQQSLGPYAKDSSDSLRDAMADMSDTLDGATKALAVQEKKFPEMKREARMEAKTLKRGRKEEKRRNKRERKLRKREHKAGSDDDSGQN